MEILEILFSIIIVVAIIFLIINKYRKNKLKGKYANAQLITSVVAVFSLVGMMVTLSFYTSSNQASSSGDNEIVDKPKASFKMLGHDKLIDYWHNTNVTVNKGNTFIDDQMTAYTDDNGRVTFKMQTRNNNDVDVQEGNENNIKTTKDGQSTINFNLNGNQKSEKLILDISEKGKDDRTIEFVANNNSKEYLNNKKNKDEQQNKKNAEIEKEDRNNFDSYDTGSLKKKNEQNNLKDYKNDLKKVPSATKGAITDACVDDNGSEQTVAVLSSDASMADRDGLKTIAKNAYNTIDSYVQTYKPFPDGSLADMIRIEDSSGNVVAKTSWGSFKFVE